MFPKLDFLFCGITSSYTIPGRIANLKTRFFEFSKFCAAGANFLKISRRSRKLHGRGFYAPRCAKSARYTAFSRTLRGLGATSRTKAAPRAEQESPHRRGLALQAGPVVHYKSNYNGNLIFGSGPQKQKD